MIIVVTGFFLMVFPAKLWHRLIRSLPLISPFELPSAVSPEPTPAPVVQGIWSIGRDGITLCFQITAL